MIPLTIPYPLHSQTQIWSMLRFSTSRRSATRDGRACRIRRSNALRQRSSYQDPRGQSCDAPERDLDSLRVGLPCVLAVLYNTSSHRPHQLGNARGHQRWDSPCFLRDVRCIQPVVFPSPLPRVPFFLWHLRRRGRRNQRSTIRAGTSLRPETSRSESDADCTNIDSHRLHSQG